MAQDQCFGRVSGFRPESRSGLSSRISATQPTTVSSRKGSAVKTVLFVVLALVIVVVATISGGAYWAHSKLAAQTSSPIQVAPLPDMDKVQQGFDSKCKETAAALVAGKEGSVALSSDECQLILRQVVPENVRDSVRVTLQGDLALIQIPMKGSQASGFIPPEWSTIRWYVGRLNYVNLEAKARISYDSSGFNVEIVEIARPLAFSPSQLQSFLNEVARGRSQSAVKFPLGSDQVTLTSLALKDSTAVVKFQR